jgi:hypothetical protein
MDKPTPRLNQTKFHRPGHASLTYVATPTYGETLAQVMDEAYWAHVAAELKAGYKIEVMPEGLPYYAELLVVHAEPTRAVVKLLNYVDLVNEAKAPVTAEILQEVAIGAKYKAERRGKWFRVLRVADQEVMKTGFVTMAEALTWARENLKVEA